MKFFLSLLWIIFKLESTCCADTPLKYVLAHTTTWVQEGECGLEIDYMYAALLCLTYLCSDIASEACKAIKGHPHI